MPNHPIIGHEGIRTSLAAAWSRGRLPQVLLFTGEPGVGKQRLGLWLAQLVMCGRPTKGPCGSCRPCRLVLDLCHADVHWFIPVPRPKATDPDKQVEELRELLSEAMAERRANGVYGRPDGLAMHGVASARLLLRLAAMTTVEGGPRVFLIGDADRLVPQEASPDAANVLLKFLEEPLPSTLVILTTTDASRVLPTIRSRAVSVRVGRLSDEEVDRGLASLAPSLAPSERRSRVSRAAGSLGRALVAPSQSAEREAALALLAAMKQEGAARFERILAQPPWQARGEFSAVLDQLSSVLGEAARAAAGGRIEQGLPDSLARVADPERFLIGLDRIEAARELARGNVNPQLLLSNLSRDLAETLWR